MTCLNARVPVEKPIDDKSLGSPWEIDFSINWVNTLLSFHNALLHKSWSDNVTEIFPNRAMAVFYSAGQFQGYFSYLQKWSLYIDIGIYSFWSDISLQTSPMLSFSEWGNLNIYTPKVQTAFLTYKFSLNKTSLTYKVGQYYFNSHVLSSSNHSNHYEPNSTYSWQSMVYGIGISLKHTTLGHLELLGLDIANLTKNSHSLKDPIYNSYILSKTVFKIQPSSWLPLRTGGYYRTHNLITNEEHIFQMQLTQFYTHYFLKKKSNTLREEHNKNHRFYNITGFTFHYSPKSLFYLTTNIYISLGNEWTPSFNIPYKYVKHILGYSISTELKSSIIPISPNYYWILYLQLLYIQGPQFDSYGNLLSYGFVGWKQPIGGLLLRQIWGSVPQAYHSPYGVWLSIHSLPRSSSIIQTHLKWSNKLYKSISLIFEAWLLWDNSRLNNQNTSQTNITSLSLDALKRLNSYLGTELNFTLKVRPHQTGYIQITYALFLPGSFFNILGPTLQDPAGSTPFWSIQLSSQMQIIW